MTLEEAIIHCEEVASRMFDDRVHCIKCAEEHKQLTEWLRDYKRLLEQPPLSEVLGEIKNELKEEITGLDRDLEKDCTIRWVCDVIDRYIGGKE